MAKIKDIADLTGYSITTVSRVLNQDENFNVSEETRHQVLTAAEKLNYVPLRRRSGQKETKNKTSLTIGLAYWYSQANEITDPYYLSIRVAIEAYCDTHKLDLKLFYLTDTGYGELKSANLDGLIALGKYSDSEIAQLREINPNFVLVDCYTKERDIDVVMVDLEEATESIIDYFLSIGVKNVGFIGGLEDTLDGNTLEDIRLKTFLQHEIRNDDYIYLGAFNTETGYEIMQNIIRSKNLQQGYIVASDAIAIGCLRALNEHKIKVPEEVSLISYDNISLAQFTIPALSTVDLNTKHIGTTAVETLVERIRTERQLAKKIFIPTELILRESCKQAK